MSSTYNNIPFTQSSNQTVQAFDNYYSAPIELNASVVAAMTGYFTNRGFGEVSAESIAVTIIKQAKKDNYNPMQILDTLKGLNDVELSGLVSEILNYNRFKSSSLGYAQTFQPNPDIARNIIDNTPLVPLYYITSSVSTADEGDLITFTINTVNVKSNTILYWDVEGVSASDFDENISSGTVTIINGSATISLSLKTDNLTEDVETITLNLRRESPNSSIVAQSSINVNDTSFSILADYIIIEYAFADGRDLDTRTRIVTPAVGTYVGWGFNETVSTILLWSGDNTGIGRESVLLNVDSFKNNYPGNAEILVDCRAQWFGEIGTAPVGLNITLYQGGEMVQDEGGFKWNNPTAMLVKTLGLTFSPITLYSQDDTSIGERIATLRYNVLTGVGYLDSTDTTEYP
jgi:hypothetical protein